MGEIVRDGFEEKNVAGFDTVKRWAGRECSDDSWDAQLFGDSLAAFGDTPHVKSIDIDDIRTALEKLCKGGIRESATHPAVDLAFGEVNITKQSQVHRDGLVHFATEAFQSNHIFQR